MGADGLYKRIVHDLVEAGRDTPYAADANEPDPRYLGYGVRVAARGQIIARHRADLRGLPTAAKLALATRLIGSGYGEQKAIALHLLEQIEDWFQPHRFDVLDNLVRQLHGWSKIDAFTGSLLRHVLERHPTEFLPLVGRWNRDPDQWLRRASVVLFTRKVAASGRFNDIALRHCDSLKFAAEDTVRKGVGWALKDLMRSDRARVLDYVIELRRERVSSVITLYALRDVRGAERARILNG